MSSEEDPFGVYYDLIDPKARFETLLGDAKDATEIRAKFEKTWNTLRDCYQEGDLLTREGAIWVAKEVIRESLPDLLAQHEKTALDVPLTQLERVTQERDDLKAQLLAVQEENQLLQASQHAGDGEAASFTFNNDFQSPSDQLELSLSRLSVNPIESMDNNGDADRDSQMVEYDDMNAPLPSIMQDILDDDVQPQPTIDPAQLQRNDNFASYSDPVEDAPLPSTASNTFGTDSAHDSEYMALRESYENLYSQNKELREKVDWLETWKTSVWRKHYNDEKLRQQIIDEERQRLQTSAFEAANAEPNHQTNESKKRPRPEDDEASMAEEESDDDDSESERASSVVPGDRLPKQTGATRPPFNPPRPRTSSTTPSRSSASEKLTIRISPLSAVRSTLPARGIKRPRITSGNNNEDGTKKAVGSRTSGPGKSSA